mmetsp:Transcript_9191/g.32528  ORF Transcript_9191/g.32528 Transcript_9191/m.32528 type:complete len:142 (+) Transcript_9191:89-514(+)
MVAARRSTLALAVAALAATACLRSAAFVAGRTAQSPALRAGRVAVAADGNMGGDFWAHPWAEELSKSPKTDNIEFDDVVAHFNALREKNGLDMLQPGSSPLVILEGIVLNSGLSGQPGMNKAQRIADGIQASSFLLSELTE